MHVLPLPFGLALALMRRREVDQIRGREIVRRAVQGTISRPDRFPNDIRYFRV